MPQLPAEDHWIALKSGPFEVFSNAGERPAREKLMYLEQFRETLRVITGKDRNAHGLAGSLIHFQERGRDALHPQAVRAGTRCAHGRDHRKPADFSTDSLKELARLLIYENTNRLPAEMEKGLIELVSTVQIDGTRITLGAPVPEAERSPGWALMHLVTVNPEYAGRSSVMISNLGAKRRF